MVKTNKAAAGLFGRMPPRWAGLPGLVLAFAPLGVAPARAQTATEVVLYNFGGTEGDQPVGGVISDEAGNLYGTTCYGGTHGDGVVYELDTAGQYTVLHTFIGGAGGECPIAGVVRDPAGNLYGTTLHGGPAKAGVVYKVDAAGQYTVLHGFTGGTDGGFPYAGLTLDPAGNLYGTASSGGIINSTCPAGCGVVFTVDAASQFTVLHSFTGADGYYPHAGVILDPAGNIYGTTYKGGASGGGVVYELDPAGEVTVLYNFTGGADGGQPNAGVIHDADGNLFGTTFGGGTAYYGTVYKLDTAGQETVLHSFRGGGQGRQPDAGVIRDSAGNLYGTTIYGGKYAFGAVFKLEPQ